MYALNQYLDISQILLMSFNIVAVFEIFTSILFIL